MSAVDPMDLEEQFFPTSAAQWQRWIPWIRLLRGFRMAIGGRRMLLAFLALLLWSAGDWLILSGLSAAPDQRPPVIRWPWNQLRMFAGDLNDLVIVRNPTTSELIEPMTRVLDPARSLLISSTPVPSHLPLILQFLLGAVISAVFGGAIARMTAVDFATHSDLSLSRSLRFSLRHWAAALGAPLIALSGFACCWLFNFFGGLLANIPVVGEILVAVCWGLLILSGFVMAFILLVIGLGWPLMIAAVSTESGDAFDALSRGVSYLLNRPWYALFLALLAVLYGIALLIFVRWMTEFTAWMTIISYRAGLFDGSGQDPTAASIRLIWDRLLFSVPAAFVFSYFWTSVTLIYFLLRKREDATPLNDVWLPEGTEEPSAPLVGIPAAQRRELRLRPEPPAGSSSGEGA